MNLITEKVLKAKNKIDGIVGEKNKNLINDINNFASDKNMHVFVFIFAEYCGHCKDAYEDWTKFEKNIQSKLNNNVKVYAITSSLFSQNGHNAFDNKIGESPNGFPTFRHIHKGNVTEYNGERKASNFIEWVENAISDSSNIQKGGKSTRKKTRKNRKLNKNSPKLKAKTRKIKKSFRKIKKASLKRQKGGNQEEKDNYLFDAIDMDEADKVERALNNGADKNAIYEPYGWPALYWAIYKENPEIVAILLEKGADVNAKTNNGWTALYSASRGGYTEIASMLLEKGADINAKDNYGNTALMWASHYGHIEIVALLLKNEADVNMKDNSDGTALQMASEKGRTEIVRMLLDKGADVNATDNNGRTALQWASINGRTSVVELLQKAIKYEQIRKDNKQKAMELVTNRVEKVPSLQTMSHRNIDTHATMLYNKALMDGTVPPLGSKLGGKRKTRKSKKSKRKGRKTKKRQRGGNSEAQEEKDKYLFDAIGIYDYDKVENALNNGANVNAQNNDGDTPLMQAIMIEDYDMVQLLLEHPDINIELDVKRNKELRLAEELTPEDEEQNGIPYLIEDYILTKNQIKKQKDDNIKELSNYKRRNIPSLSTLAYQQSPSVLDTHINLNPGTINRPYRKLGGKRKTKKSKTSKRKTQKNNRK